MEDTKGDRDKDVSEIQEDTSVVYKKWESISAGRAEECLREAIRRGGKPLNTSRLNIVGEGRAGKTAWLRAVSNKAFEDTTSTVGVKQSLLEVDKVDMETKFGGGWSVVEEGTLIMKADEAMTRLAAEIAITEPQVYMHDPPPVGTDRAEKASADKTAVQKAAAEKVAADAKAASEAKAAAKKTAPSAGGKSAVEKKSFFALLSGSKKSTSIYPMSPKAEKKFLKKVNKVIPGVLTEMERTTLLKAVRKHSQGMAHTGVGVRDLVIGDYQQAIDGLNVLLGLQDDEHLLANAQLPNAEKIDIERMEREIRALNIKEASELIVYVLYQGASEKKYFYGIRDRGCVGKTLNDFVNDPIAKKAKLTKADVAALRIYTSALFKYINDPLRNSDGRPHPLPITVLLLSRALKKLKRVTGREDSEMVVWRGMKNIRATDEFIMEGGKFISHTPCEQDISFSILNINFGCRNGACANVDNHRFGSGSEVRNK